jgi:hypothetical protein
VTLVVIGVLLLPTPATALGTLMVFMAVAMLVEE